MAILCPVTARLGLAATSLLMLAAAPSDAARKALVPELISFSDARHGVAAAFGSAPAWTRDGGRTWHRLDGPTGVTGLVAVPSSRVAWASVSARAVACSGIPPSCALRLYRSRDGGRSWSRSSGRLFGLDFADRSDGWAFRPVNDIEYGRLVATRDGGLTWHRAVDPCPRARSMGKLAARASRRDGWILCLSQPGTGQQLKLLFATHDGGRRWRLVMNDRGARTIGSSGYARGMDFLRSGLGIVWESRGHSYITRDAGRTWSALALTSPELVEISSASLVSERIALAVVRNGRRRRIELRRSSDGLRTWRVVRSWAWR
jgi:photosystem II stability/assembly factor-like uncharacterized protein